ncbi:MAG: hypothetical protein A3F84_23900 [Candidatus Handelsmanbacteria bacterium RIFCSPLOWO2_12_FULL_64_10]|uniref:Helix-turn-helix domain-containing protein n=1 Tax=Handelsmanbacteria sp. (strain RIFCSPLOWO2_12_FULL_64_10) TaxID=1817868 RepID=A0A1F6CAP0_HANXR|nr:MAG: hypothetical protein A3F84_23900 [Candidatus Handelsmanbacteria bacterium RIFCSPLOWO2_12_FULL_64_10]
MNASERQFYDTYIRPHQNGPALKLLLFLALGDASSEEPFVLSYRDLAQRVGLDRHTLIHAVRRLSDFQVQGVPILERVEKGRGRKSSVYAVHLPKVGVVDK